MFSQPRRWSPTSRRLAGLFLVVLLPPSVALVVLGLQLLSQDERLIAQRVVERREAVADAIVRAFESDLAAATSEPDGLAVRLLLSSKDVRAIPPDALLWT